MLNAETMTEANEVLAVYHNARTETSMTLEEFNHSIGTLLAELDAEEESEDEYEE
jgi:hypothetical protein